MSFLSFLKIYTNQQAKFSTDMTGYAPAGLSSSLLSFNLFSLVKSVLGYVVDPTQFIRGISPLHDSGTGSSLGKHSVPAKSHIFSIFVL